MNNTIDYKKIHDEVVAFFLKEGYIESQEKVDVNAILSDEYDIDSLTMVEIIMFCEEQYGFEFNLDELDLNNFGTIDNICNSIYTKITGSEK